MVKFKKVFKKLSSLLNSKFTRRSELSRQLEIVKVFEIYWQEIKKFFPQEKEIQLISLKNKVLKVQVRSSVLANELRMREKQIITTVNEKLGKEVLKRVGYRF